jgi:hypothetical protein
MSNLAARFVINFALDSFGRPERIGMHLPSSHHRASRPSLALARCGRRVRRAWTTAWPFSPRIVWGYRT